MKRQAQLLKWFKILFAFFLVFFLIQKIDFVSLKMTFQETKISALFGYVLLQVLALFLSVKKWQLVSKARNISFHLLPGIKQYLVGMFINNFLPSTVGGDVYRSRWLSKEASVGFTKAVYTVLFERLQGVFVVLAITLFIPLFFWDLVIESPIVSLSVLASAIILTGFFIVLFFFPKENALAWFNILPGKVRQLLLSLRDDYRSAEWRRGLFVTFLFIVIGPILSNFVLLRGVGAEIPFEPFFFLAALATIFVSLPLTIGNIGVKESAYVLLFSILGVTLEQAIAAALLGRVMQLLLSLSALPLYVTEKNEAKTR